MIAFTTIERLPDSIIYGTNPSCKKTESYVREGNFNDALKLSFDSENYELILTTIDKGKPNSIINKHHNGKSIIHSYVSGTPFQDIEYEQDKTELIFIVGEQPLTSRFGSSFESFYNTFLEVQEQELVEDLVFTIGNKQENETKQIIKKTTVEGKDQNKFNSKIITMQDFLNIEQTEDYVLTDSNITFTTGLEPGSNSLSLLSNPKITYSSIKIPVTSNTELISKRTSFKAYIKDAGLGGGSLEIGKLNMTLHIYRLYEYRFEFPKNYLNGLVKNSIAYADGDVLVVHSWEIGEVILYTDAGTITVRTVPALKINKARLAGITGIEPVIKHS